MVLTIYIALIYIQYVVNSSFGIATNVKEEEIESIFGVVPTWKAESQCGRCVWFRWKERRNWSCYPWWSRWVHGCLCPFLIQCTYLVLRWWRQKLAVQASWLPFIKIGWILSWRAVVLMWLLPLTVPLKIARWLVGYVVEDCKEYMSEFHSIVVRHLFREANGVVHRLSFLLSWSPLDNLWLDEIPFIIENVLFKKLCNCARNSGSMSPSNSTLVTNN